MSGETEEQRSGWTVDTLNYAISQRLDDLEKLLDQRATAQDTAVQAALAAADRATAKAEIAAEKRFESVNEFRGQLSDQANTFVPRAEASAIQKRNDERIEDLKGRIDRAEGQGQGYSAFAGWAVAAISLVVTVVIAANAIFKQ